MKKAIWLLIFACLIYTGIQFAKPYYRYLAFKSDAKEIARISVEMKSEDAIRKMLYERAQELKIPIDKDDIDISVTDKMVRIRTSWVEVVDILGIYRKALTFSTDSRE